MAARARGAGRKPESETGPAETWDDDPARLDYIDYLADMIHELQRMAEQGGLVTLSGILRLAHTEALSCRERER